MRFVSPRWDLDAGSWWQWGYVAAAVGVVHLLWVSRDRLGRGPLVAGAYFLVAGNDPGRYQEFTRAGVEATIAVDPRGGGGLRLIW